MKTLFLFVAASAWAFTLSTQQFTFTGALEVSARSVLEPEDARPTNEQCIPHCSNFSADLQGCDDDDDCFCTMRVRADFIECSSCNAAQNPSQSFALQEKANELVHRCSDNHTPIESIILNGTSSGNPGNSTGSQGNTTSQQASPTGQQGDPFVKPGNSTTQPLLNSAIPKCYSALVPWIAALGGVMWSL